MKLGTLQVGSKVKARWVGCDYKGDRYYDAVTWQYDGMVKSYQTDAQRLMFS